MNNAIGVIGAGVMGCGVALDLATCGYNVILHDNNDAVLENAKKKILFDFREVQFFKKDLKINTKELLEAQLHFTNSYEHFANVNFVIENITESWHAKQALYTEMTQRLSPDMIYAVNTSCIPITKVAALCPKPEKVIGMHFMNPVPLKSLVEVIRGYYTNTETIDSAKNLLKSLNKNAVIVNDSPGFVSNRLSHLFMNEAAFLVYENVAEPKDIDRLFKQGYEHKMGPLETADLIGLDTVVNSLNVLYESYQDSKFKCCPLLTKMVAAGLLGCKSGQGFYKY